MEFTLDAEEKALVKTLYDAWQDSIKQAEYRKRMMEKYIQQLTQINGVDKKDYNAAEWSLNFETGKLTKNA